MAFTVEDGSGLAAANSFTSVAEADAFFADRGVPQAWSLATTTVKEQALVKATEYINSQKRFAYRGTKAGATQRLQWPRTGASEYRGPDIADNVVPGQVKDATAVIAALIASGTDLTPVLQRGGMITSVKVDVISTTFAEGAPAEDTVVEVVDALSPLLRRRQVDATGTHAPAQRPDAFDEANTFGNPRSAF